MNKELYNNASGVIDFPKDKREHMAKCMKMAGDVREDIEGYQRNKELQGKETIDYKQLKRIKNFFDNFTGDQKDPSFILNGGVTMKNWVNDILRRMREGQKLTKTNKMETGMMNQFIRPHEKKDFTNVRKSKEHSSTLSKYDVAVTESLKRINEIISKI